MYRSGVGSRSVQDALTFAKACKIMFDSAEVAESNSGLWFFRSFISSCHRVNGKMVRWSHDPFPLVTFDNIFGSDKIFVTSACHFFTML